MTGHPGLAAWFAVGAFDWLINAAVGFQFWRQTGRNVFESMGRKTGLSPRLSFGMGVALSFAGGPFSLAHTCFLLPSIVRKARERKQRYAAYFAKEEERNRLLDENAHARGALLGDLARCGHDFVGPIVCPATERGGAYCNDCGSVCLDDRWRRPTFNARAVELEDALDALEEES